MSTPLKGVKLKNGTIGYFEYISYIDQQNLTEDQKAIARDNIGISSLGSGVGKTTTEGGEIFNDYSNNKAGEFAHAEGHKAEAIGYASHAEGGAHYDPASVATAPTQARGDFSHAEGISTEATGEGAHSEGFDTLAEGYYSHAEGMYSKAIGVDSHAEGYMTYAYNDSSHAEGVETNASGYASHAEGIGTHADNEASHAEGEGTRAGPICSHAEGYMTYAAGGSSHAGGFGSNALKDQSFATGFSTIANAVAQFACGKNNIKDNAQEFQFIVGNGAAASDLQRNNAFTVSTTGKATAYTTQSETGADYAEYFEWSDGNLSNEDRVGLAVTLDMDKIRLAQAGDEVLGVVSGTAAVIGDVAEWNWQNKYLKDDFGRTIWIMEEEFATMVNRETGEEYQKSMGFFPHQQINPDFDPNQTYIPRKERKEWDTIGMLGKLFAKDDGTCIPGGWAKVSKDGILTASSEKTNIRVMKRTKENIVWVLLK